MRTGTFQRKQTLKLSSISGQTFHSGSISMLINEMCITPIGITPLWDTQTTTEQQGSLQHPLGMWGRGREKRSMGHSSVQRGQRRKAGAAALGDGRGAGGQAKAQHTPALPPTQTVIGFCRPMLELNSFSMQCVVCHSTWASLLSLGFWDREPWRTDLLRSIHFCKLLPRVMVQD